MTKTCRECNKDKDISLFGIYRDSYDNIKYHSKCKPCRTKVLSERRRLKKISEKNIETYIDPEEQAPDAFKDDPRAAKEVDYGRVVRKPTFVIKGGLID